MATSVVETPRIIATLPTRPQDGDDAYMDAGAAPLMPVLQHLYDAAGALRIAALGQMSGGDRLSVDPGGTSTVFAVRVSRIVGLLSRQTGSTPIYATYTAAETVLDLTDVDGAPANLSNSVFYYVYLFSNGTSTTQAYITTVAPEASLTWRTGAEGVDRYVGCFRTNSSGAPLPMRMHRGRYIYRRSAMASDPFRVLSSTTPAGYTDISLATLLPPHARTAILDLNVDAGGGIAYLDLRTKGDTSDVSIHVVAGTTAEGGSSHGSIEMETDSAQAVQYELALGTAATLQGQVWVTGFVE
jgi:hypothetical protein